MDNPNRRILCVDDDEDTCELLSFFLRKYELILAHTFADAVTKALSGTFDAILLDSHLPDGSGIDLCKQIRESDINAPIIFYSADAFPKRIEEAMEAGATKYLVKPLSPDDVEKAIEKLLS
jgi:DNA-binding response OmpR family regulator